MTLTSLLIDDEELPRKHLQRLLERESVSVVGEASCAQDALSLATELCPDVVFLDIEMPEMTGIDIADRLIRQDKPPAIVFVTGYSEYALAAFDRGAVDYLVKPVMRSRLAETLTRLRARIDTTSSITEADPPVLRRLSIRDDYRIRLIRAEDVELIESRRKSVFIRTAEGEFRSHYTLKGLEERLPTDKFMRVHESFIVNLDLVEELLFLGNHVYELRLSNKSRVPVGRHRFTELQSRLGMR